MIVNRDNEKVHMEFEIEKISLGILARLPHLLNAEGRNREWGNMFMVAYYIINTMAIKKNSRVKIYRSELADLCDFKSTKSITEATNKLNDIGIIKKDLVGDAESSKTFNYYTINYSRISELAELLGEEYVDWWNDCTSLKKVSRKEKKKQSSKESSETEFAEKPLNDDGLPF